MMVINDVNNEIKEFKEYLRNSINLSGSSIIVYSHAAKSFLKTNPNLLNIDNYNKFLIEHIIKKRSTYFSDAIKRFLDFLSKKYKENKKQFNSIKRNLIKNKYFNPIVKTKYLNKESRFNIIKNIEDYRHKIIALIQLELGVRVGDVIRLKRGSIYYETYNEYIVMCFDFRVKGNKKKVMYIFDKAIQEEIEYFLENNYFDEEFYFLKRPERKHKNDIDYLIKYNYKYYLLDLKNALKKTGFSTSEFSTHDFRRCRGREIWEKYKDIEILKKFFGHQKVDTTLRYLSTSGMNTADILKEIYKDENL